MRITKQLLFAFLLAGGMASVAQAQAERTAPGNEKQKVTYEMLVSQYNFPVKQNTGNQELDHQKYREAKNKWIAANKALYEKYNSQGVQGNRAARQAIVPVVTKTK